MGDLLSIWKHRRGLSATSVLRKILLFSCSTFLLFRIVNAKPILTIKGHMRVTWGDQDAWEGIAAVRGPVFSNFVL